MNIVQPTGWLKNVGSASTKHQMTEDFFRQIKIDVIQNLSYQLQIATHYCAPSPLFGGETPTKLLRVVSDFIKIE